MGGRLLKTLGLVAAVLGAILLVAPPANASLIWDGDASQGPGIFDGIECDSPGFVEPFDYEGQTTVWKFYKPAGLKRCEARGITVNGSEYEFQNGSTYYIGWRQTVSVTDVGTVFQWKSYPNSQQNYPAIMKVEDAQLKLFHIHPGEEWELIWSTPIDNWVWNSIVLGIHTSDSESGGWFELYYNGVQQTFEDGSHRFVGRTWDSENRPKWGTYGNEVSETSTINYLDDLKIGTTYADVAP